MAKVEITTPYSAYGTVVKIDGVEVPHLTDVRFQHKCGEMPKLILEIMPSELVFSGEIEPESMETQWKTKPPVLLAERH